MSKEKDFFKTCFNTVAGLEVENESQEIAKTVILNEIENLQKENEHLDWVNCHLRRTNEKLKGAIQTYGILLKANVEENKQLKDKWNALKKYAKDIVSTDNELYGTDLLNKMLELERGERQ